MPKKSNDAKVRTMVGSNLRYARTMRRWSQEQLAELAGLHRTGVGALERADAAATVDSLAALGRAIGVAPHVLLMPPAEAQPIILASVAAPRARTR